jgi:hypothetical protein
MPIGAKSVAAWALSATLAVGALSTGRSALASSGPAATSEIRQIPTATETVPSDEPVPVTASPVPVPAASETEAPPPAVASPGPETPSIASPGPETPASAMGPAPAQVTAIGLFPDVSIAGVLNGALPGTILDDHQIQLGGVGSDIWHGPDDPPGELWMLTDRGPRGRDDNGKDKQAFAIPEYTPMILHVRIAPGAAGGNGVYSVEILEAIPIVGQSGRPVTGLPNLDSRDERPVDFRAKVKLDYNPNGLDPEGLVRTPNGDFWIAEEYGPSLVHLDPKGRVLTRFVPEGVELPGTDYPVEVGLPALFAKRSSDQGFEGLTASPDGSTLYMAMQGPLSNPNNNTGDRSRQARILAFDVASEQVSAEYVYRFELIRAFDPSKKADPEDMKISALAMSPGGQLLVLERTPNAARLYLADPHPATNILGSRWDDPALRPSLEAAESMAVVGILPMVKTMAVDLTPLDGVPDKLEGVAIMDASNIVVANDNDFDVNKFDNKGANQGKGDKSQVVTISLPQPLP